MKTRITLPLVAIVSLLAIAAVFVFRPLPTTITRENAARLRVGMTVAEAVSILGEPRDEARWQPASLPTPYFPSAPGSFPTAFLPPPPHDRRRWVSESLVIIIDSNPNDLAGKVVSIDIANHEFGSPWQFALWRVRRVLGLAPDVPLPVEIADDSPLTVW